MFFCVCACVVVYLCRFPFSSSSWHGYQVNFGSTFVYAYVYDCVNVFFLLLLVIGIGQPLFRNFGRTFECACARVSACVCARACVGVCFAIARHRDSSILLISFAHVGACTCACKCIRVCAYVYVSVCVAGCSPIHSDVIRDQPKTSIFTGFEKRMTDGPMDRQTNGPTDGQTDGQSDRSLKG